MVRLIEGPSGYHIRLLSVSIPEMVRLIVWNFTTYTNSICVSIPEMVRLIAGFVTLTGKYHFCFNSRDGAIDRARQAVPQDAEKQFQFQRWCD